MGCGTGQSLIQARKYNSQFRQDAMTQKIAVIGGIGIAFVFDPAQGMSAGVIQQGLARFIQQWAHQACAAIQKPGMRHGGQAIQAAAAQQIEKNRFGLVVAVMSKQQGIACLLFEHRIPGLPGRSFDTTAILRHTHLFDQAINTQRSRRFLRKSSPSIGILRKTMMDMHRVERKTMLFAQAGKQMKEDDGIKSTGKTDAQTGIRRQIKKAGKALPHPLRKIKRFLP
ncbi:hypothetical protein SAMN05660284_00226 [Formivibrio citricus]|uniref:Uncharacterized protein n=1 Tax=Formivibrio citricus TaxID=83765 RepID=A0A1I4VCD4_9NEIS|nr:hypothetical protein SAMN05660284_00226 [Formivibrio citricus]